MLNVVLVEPEIAQNAGNIARTCACTGARLHLVEPLGFRLTDKYLKRSGLDYWDKVELKRWPCLAAFLEENQLSVRSANANLRSEKIPEKSGENANSQSEKNPSERGAPTLSKMHLFTGRTDRTIADVTFGPDDYLLFGRETAGLPVDLINAHQQDCVRIPMQDNTRSLNLANSVAIGLYEALRQNNYFNLG